MQENFLHKEHKKFRAFTDLIHLPSQLWAIFLSFHWFSLCPKYSVKITFIFLIGHFIQQHVKTSRSVDVFFLPWHKNCNQSPQPASVGLPSPYWLISHSWSKLHSACSMFSRYYMCENLRQTDHVTDLVFQSCSVCSWTQHVADMVCESCSAWNQPSSLSITHFYKHSDFRGWHSMN